MSWVLIDDEFYDHPKWRTAPGDSIAMWVAAIAWCNRSEAWDGRIPTTKLAGLVAVRIPKRTITDLEDRQAMHRDGDSHVVHDFAAWQQVAKRKAISDARREAGRRGAAVRWNANDNTDANTDGKCHVSSDAQPPTTNNRVPVSDNSTPENTPPGVDNSRRDQVLDAYAVMALDTAKARGPVRSDAAYRRTARATANGNPDLDRWLIMFPTAPATAVAAWLTGDKHSMSYYARHDEQPDATIHHLPGAS